MKIVPMKLKEANVFVGRHHRHSKPVVGHRFSIGLENGAGLIGVAIVGRPVSRVLDSRLTAEVLRLCVLPAAEKGSCSKLYSACWKIWRAMGGNRLITYTLVRESGASLRGAGWKQTAQARGREWSCPSRLRATQDNYAHDKLRWEMP